MAGTSISWFPLGRNPESKRKLRALFLVLLLGLASCGGENLEAQLAEQTQRIEELEQRLAEATATTSTTISTTTTTPATTTTTMVETRDVNVTFDLVDDRNWQEDADGCEGEGFYSDITSRTEMVLEDESGRRLAVAQLGTGDALIAGALGTDYGASFCRFRFTFNDVPVDRSLYTVVSGRRGSVTFEPRSTLFMSLGS